MPTSPRLAATAASNVTVGNASGMNDADAAVVLTERAEAEERGRTPVGLVDYSVADVEPKSGISIGRPIAPTAPRSL